MKIRPTVSVSALLVCALAALLLAAGCDRLDSAAPQIAETDEPGFRRGRELERQGRESEAIIEFNKLLARRGLDSAPETNLELGILNQRRDPTAAIFHFRKYLQLRPNSDRDTLVRQRIEVALREYVSSLPGRPSFDSLPGSADLMEQNRKLQDDNDRLRAELTAARAAAGGAGNGNGVGTPGTGNMGYAGNTDNAGNAGYAGYAGYASNAGNMGNVIVSSAPPPLSPAGVAVAVQPATPSAGPLAPVAPQPEPARAVQSQAQQQQPAQQQPAQQPQRQARQSQQTQQSQQPAQARQTTQAMQAQPSRAAARTYVVKQHDSLFSIARQIYGTASNAQVEAIVGANRDTLTAGRNTPLREGMVLKLP